MPTLLPEQTETVSNYRFNGPVLGRKDALRRNKGFMAAERSRKRQEAEARDRELPQNSPLRKKNKALDLAA